jgi:hypothetical protein
VLGLCESLKGGAGMPTWMQGKEPSGIDTNKQGDVLLVVSTALAMTKGSWLLVEELELTSKVMGDTPTIQMTYAFQSQGQT